MGEEIIIKKGVALILGKSRAMETYRRSQATNIGSAGKHCLTYDNKAKFVTTSSLYINERV